MDVRGLFGGQPLVTGETMYYLRSFGGVLLLSLVGDLSVCQIVDPQLTVRMGIDQSILDAYEVQLP